MAPRLLPHLAKVRRGPQVRKEFVELYSKYAPLWEKEESERARRWAAFLAAQHGAEPEHARCPRLPAAHKRSAAGRPQAGAQQSLSSAR
jgi:hypothetical protein